MIDFWTPSYESVLLIRFDKTLYHKFGRNLIRQLTHITRYDGKQSFENHLPTTNCLHDNQIHRIARPNSHNPSSIRLRHLVKRHLLAPHVFPASLSLFVTRYLRWRNGRVKRSSFSTHMCMHIYRVACNLSLEIRETITLEQLDSQLKLKHHLDFSVYTSLYKMRREIEIN